MQDKKPNPVLTFPKWEPKVPLDLVVAYEDDPTRDSAISLCKKLTETLLEAYDLQCSWWPLGCLPEPRIREQAVEAAIHADLILLALRTGGQLDWQTRQWVESWRVRREERPCALVLLIHEAAGRAEDFAAESYLRQAARSCKMDFFLHGPSLAAQMEPYSLERIEERAQTVTPLLQQIMSPR